MTAPAAVIRQVVDSIDLKYTLRINGEGQSGEALIRFERRINQGSALTIQGAAFVFPCVRFSVKKYNLWTACVWLTVETALNV